MTYLQFTVMVLITITFSVYFTSLCEMGGKGTKRLGAFIAGYIFPLIVAFVFADTTGLDMKGDQFTFGAVYFGLCILAVIAAKNMAEICRAGNEKAADEFSTAVAKEILAQLK